MKARFHLVYDGPALSEHRMDVRALAPALLAMGDLFDRANQIFNGQQVKVALNVRASFKTGSFGIDLELLTSLWQQVLDLVGSPQVLGAKEILEWLGIVGAPTWGLVKVIKWLRGRGVRKVVPIGDGIVRLYVDDEHIDVEEQVVKLLQDYLIRKHLEAVFTDPLRHEGVTVAAIADAENKQIGVTVDRSEARFFVAPDPAEEELADDTFEATLQVLTLAFQDGNKWRFSDGATSFFATVLDEGFLNRVRSNQEMFARDDIIRAKVRRVQRLTKEGLKAEHEVLQVLEHRSASPHVQIRLQFGQDDKSA